MHHGFSVGVRRFAAAAVFATAAATSGADGYAVYGLGPYGTNINDSTWCTTGRVAFAQSVGRASASGTVVAFRGTYGESANAISFKSTSVGLAFVVK